MTARLYEYAIYIIYSSKNDVEIEGKTQPSWQKKKNVAAEGAGQLPVSTWLQTGKCPFQFHSTSTGNPPSVCLCLFVCQRLLNSAPISCVPLSSHIWRDSDQQETQKVQKPANSSARSKNFTSCLCSDTWIRVCKAKFQQLMMMWARSEVQKVKGSSKDSEMKTWTHQGRQRWGLMGAVLWWERVVGSIPQTTVWLFQGLRETQKHRQSPGQKACGIGGVKGLWVRLSWARFFRKTLLETLRRSGRFNKETNRGSEESNWNEFIYLFIFFFWGGGNQTEKLFYCKHHRNTSLALFVGNHEILTGN